MSDDAYSAAQAAGIHRIALPTPFAVGRVNVFVIDDDPLTLVDSGPNSGTSLDVLERGLEALGRRVEDIQRIIVTHQHMDHIGLVQIVADRSGAEVLAIDRLVPFLANYREAAAEDDEFGSDIMRRHGIPDDLAMTAKAVSVAYRSWGAGATVTRALSEGDVVEFAGRSLEVCFRPGHSATDTVFLDRSRRMLLAGDHLLRTISSNPLISRSLEGGGRRKALIEYTESLMATREMDLELVLPGHGDPIEDHRELIDRRLKLHEGRARKIHGLIADRPRSAHELATAIWGDIAVTQAFLTLSEVIGHTDILVADGRAVEDETEDGRVVFRAADADAP